jgi:hypothetical protein
VVYFRIPNRISGSFNHQRQLRRWASFASVSQRDAFAIHVEDALARAPTRGEMIAMPVLDRDLALGAGDEALSREGQLAQRRSRRRRSTRRAGWR